MAMSKEGIKVSQGGLSSPKGDHNDIELVRSQLLLNCHLLDGFSSKLDFSPQLRLLQRKYKVCITLP